VLVVKAETSDSCRGSSSSSTTTTTSVRMDGLAHCRHLPAQSIRNNTHRKDSATPTDDQEQDANGYFEICIKQVGTKNCDRSGVSCVRLKLHAITASVGDLKRQVAQHCHVPPAQQRLIFFGRLLIREEQPLKELPMKRTVLNYVHLSPLPKGAILSKRSSQASSTTTADATTSLPTPDLSLPAQLARARRLGLERRRRERLMRRNADLDAEVEVDPYPSSSSFLYYNTSRRRRGGYHHYHHHQQRENPIAGAHDCNHHPRFSEQTEMRPEPILSTREDYPSRSPSPQQGDYGDPDSPPPTSRVGRPGATRASAPSSSSSSPPTSPSSSSSSWLSPSSVALLGHPASLYPRPAHPSWDLVGGAGLAAPPYGSLTGLFVDPRMAWHRDCLDGS